jgi:hypothetical protein
MRGLAFPSWLVAVCAAVVALALVGFVVSGERDTSAAETPATEPSTEPSAHKPDGTPKATSNEDKDRDKGAERRRPVERRTAYVEVYNNSGITGLAGETSAVLQDSGWRVVATDNWYGEIPASTVYHPQQLSAQARLLARDLGVTRVHPAVSPMSFDRITVILTGTP